MSNTLYKTDNKLHAGVQHLTAEVWNRVNRAYVAKAITEFLHEQMISPEVLGEDGSRIQFRLKTDNENVTYTFWGAHRKMDYWYIKPESVSKFVDGKEQVIDALQFFIELKETIGGVKPLTLSKFIEETSNTLYADAYIVAKGRIPSPELVDADYQTIEHQMDGHPWATVNKGRIGFSYDDYLDFVPEADQLVNLFWLAVHKSRAEYNHIEGLTHQKLVSDELGDSLVADFNGLLIDQDLSPNDYYFIPVHEWQWKHKLVFLFAGDIASQAIVPLRQSEDRYTPQQSIRTFFNVDEPKKHYVKTAISILNTSIYRGLSPKKLAIAPRVTSWVKTKLLSDTYLKDRRFTLLGEVATIGYKHFHYEQVEKGPYHYQELLGAIWRESAENYLNEDERIMTMASLLYVDDQGVSFVESLIEKSGLSSSVWLDKYLDAYLSPILHIFYRHKFFFSPHGENTILVMRNYVPERIIIKDFVEEIVLTQEGKAEAPEDVRALLREIDDEYATLFILSGVFDGVFRYLSNVFHTHVGLDQEIFWSKVASVILKYESEHPESAERFKQFDLFVPEFIRVCLNRVRLLTYGYTEDSEIPVPEISGTLENPVARFKN